MPGADTWDLASNLLLHLRSTESAGSYVARQQTIRLFTSLIGELERRVDVGENRLSPRSFAGTFGFVHFCQQNHGLPTTGATYLDIGCGSVHPYGRMFAHLMAGASRAGCLELDPIQDPGEAVRTLAHMAAAALVDPSTVFGPLPITAAAILAHIADFDLARLAKGDAGGLPQDRLLYLQRSVDATGLPDRCVDVVVSNSVLEHVADVDATLAELARITRPGGFAMHNIDAGDHRWYATPALHRLEFLTDAGTEPIRFGCNRLRMVDFERRFQMHGFAVRVRMPGPPVAMTPELRSRLQPPWSGMPDEVLCETWCQYLLQRG